MARTGGYTGRAERFMIPVGHYLTVSERLRAHLSVDRFRR
jgi:hypothetical protein